LESPCKCGIKPPGLISIGVSLIIVIIIIIIIKIKLICGLQFPREPHQSTRIIIIIIIIMIIIGTRVL
jgi:hypothetical protein